MQLQVHVPMRGGIARFVVESERFCALGRKAWGLKNLLMSPFLESCVSWWLGAIFGALLRFIVVSDRFRVMLMSLGSLGSRILEQAGIARFVMVSEKFGSSCRTAWGPQKEHRSTIEKPPSLPTYLVTSDS